MNNYFNAWILGVASIHELNRIGMPVNEGIDYFQIQKEITAYKQRMLIEQIAIEDGSEE